MPGKHGENSLKEPSKASKDGSKRNFINTSSEKIVTFHLDGVSSDDNQSIVSGGDFQVADLLDRDMSSIRESFELSNEPGSSCSSWKWPLGALLTSDAIMVADFTIVYSVPGMETSLLHQIFRLPHDVALPLNVSVQVLRVTFLLIGVVVAETQIGIFRALLGILLVTSTVHIFTTFSMIYGWLQSTLAIEIAAVVVICLVTITNTARTPLFTTFAADQYAMPEKEDDRNDYFFIQYITFNMGSVLGILVVHALRTSGPQAECNRDIDTCFHLDILLATIMAFFGLIVFAGGAPCYKTLEPFRGLWSKLVCCSWKGAIHRLSSKKDQAHPHWLDHSRKSGFDEETITISKHSWDLIFLSLPFYLIWTINAMIFGRRDHLLWRMKADYAIDGLLCTMVFHCLCIVFGILLLFLFKISRARNWKWLQPLRLMVVGLVFLVLSGFCAAILAWIVQVKDPSGPAGNHFSILLLNPLNADVSVSVKNASFRVTPPPEGKALEVVKARKFQIFEGLDLKTNYTLELWCENQHIVEEIKMAKGKEGKVVEFLLSADPMAIAKISVYDEEAVKKPSSANPVVRFVSFLEGNLHEKIFLRDENNKDELTLTLDLGDYKTMIGNYAEVKALKRYRLFVDAEMVGNKLFEAGGKYTIFVFHAKTRDSKGVETVDFTITEPNSVNIIYILALIFLSSAAEAFIWPVGTQIFYREAPHPLKAVMAGVWYLPNPTGHMIGKMLEESLPQPAHWADYCGWSVLALLVTVIYGSWIWNYSYKSLMTYSLEKIPEPSWFRGSDINAQDYSRSSLKPRFGGSIVAEAES